MKVEAQNFRGSLDHDLYAAIGLFSRFLPVISFNLINYAAGLTAISWWTFSWATGIGRSICSSTRRRARTTC